MTHTYTAVVKLSDPSWIGWVEEVPGVNCQEETKDELLETLHEAVDFNRIEALLRHLRAHGCELLRKGGRHS